MRWVFAWVYLSVASNCSLTWSGSFSSSDWTWDWIRPRSKYLSKRVAISIPSMSLSNRCKAFLLTLKSELESDLVSSFSSDETHVNTFCLWYFRRRHCCFVKRRVSRRRRLVWPRMMFRMSSSSSYAAITFLWSLLRCSWWLDVRKVQNCLQNVDLSFFTYVKWDKRLKMSVY